MWDLATNWARLVSNWTILERFQIIFQYIMVPWKTPGFVLFVANRILFRAKSHRSAIFPQVPDPNGRIGYECMDDLKHHPFFGTEDEEDWNLIHTLRPPPFDPWHDRARFGEAERKPQHPPVHEVEKDKNPFCGIHLSKKCPAFKDPPQFLDWETMVSVYLPILACYPFFSLGML